jgi:dihydrolipoamide dehydrogenase
VASREPVQVAVIGAGPGGYAAAFLAADLGLRVALVDPEPNPGGVCLYRGCIPSKALLHVARVVTEAREAKAWGIEFGAPRIDVAAMQSWKTGVVASLTGGLGQLCKQRNVAFIRGRARFTDSHTLDVIDGAGSNGALRFEHAIIATGSSPASVPALRVDSPRVLDSTTALDLDHVPRSLLVVGGGYIGLELGTVYATLGSRVTVVEMMPSILPGVDKDLVAVLSRRLDGLFESILVNTTVQEMKEQKNGIRVAVQPRGSDVKEMLFDRVLVSTGRKPNSGDLGLERAGITIDDRGFIRVDESRRTAQPHIFAIGDVAGEPMLAHKATHEGRLAAEAIAGHGVAFEPLAIPAVVFTDPEIAWCGLSETEAGARERRVEVAKFPWAASGRAKTLGRNEGLTKLLIDPETERILGAGIVGPGAGDLIAEAVVAIEMGAVAADLSLCIHPHPTLSETIMGAAEVFFGQATDIYRPKRKERSG